MTRYYVDQSEVNALVAKLNRAQAKAKLFVNIRVIPYRGKKYPQDTTVTVIVG